MIPARKAAGTTPNRQDHPPVMAGLVQAVSRREEPT